MNQTFKIIGHSLGIDIYSSFLSDRQKDKHLPLDFYRNYYCYGYDKDGTKLDKRMCLMLRLGLIKTWSQTGCLYFCITDKGIKLFRAKFKREITDTYKPPSKSKQRYQRYLEYGEMFDSFLKYCYWDAEKERSWNK